MDGDGVILAHFHLAFHSVPFNKLILVFWKEKVPEALELIVEVASIKIKYLICADSGGESGQGKGLSV